MARNILLRRLANYRSRTCDQLNRFLTLQSSVGGLHRHVQTSSVVERLIRTQEKSRHCISDAACRPIQAHRPRCVTPPNIVGEIALAETQARSAYNHAVSLTLGIGINPE